VRLRSDRDLLHVPNYVLTHDDGVINKQSDGQRQPINVSMVERESEHLHDGRRPR